MKTLKESIGESLEQAGISKSAKLVIGVSGGMDSVVLTHVLKALGFKPMVAHLNHNLRGEDSDGDELFVKELAERWGLECISRKVDIPKLGNLEANARIIRYGFLGSVQNIYELDYVVTAHHFDDQIETVLMHEKRGAGLRGKCGMQVLSKMERMKGVSSEILRPMLDVSRQEIEKYAEENDLEYRHDKTNDDLRFERNCLRHEIIPKLKTEAGFEDSIRNKMLEARQKLAELSAEKERWMQVFAQKDSFNNHSFNRHAFNQLGKDLKVEVLMSLVGYQNVYSGMLNRLIDFITNGQNGKEVNVKDKVFVIEYDQIRCMSEKSAKLGKIPVAGKADWGNYSISVSNIKPLYVRPWKAGDRFQPAGMSGTKKVQDFFVDSKIPRHQRKRIPILVDENDDIICIADMRFAEGSQHLKENIQIYEK